MVLEFDVRTKRATEIWHMRIIISNTSSDRKEYM